MAELTKTVQAAGGVVWRHGAGGAIEVLVVHRPHYNDWSLPKGKLESGETFEVAAVREVEEETGYRCELAEELPSVQYHDRNGRPKIVRYWAMTVTSGTLAFEHEVDRAEWLPAERAIPILSYPRDASVVEAFLLQH